MRLKMRLEDAMVYVLATAGYGMTTQRIAEVINNETIGCDTPSINRDIPPKPRIFEP